MWTILGINETKNNLEIKAAYFKKIEELNSENDKEEFKSLKEAYKEALKFAASEKNTYFHKAKQLMKRKLYDEAIENYEEALKIENSEEEKIYDEIAFCLVYKGEFEKAIEWYNKILKSSPKYTDVYRKMGYMYYSLKDYKNAIKYYETQIKSNGWYPAEKATDLMLIANCYEKFKDKENAVGYYNSSINTFLKTKWKTPYEYTFIAKCYQALGESNEAAEYFERAINLELCESCPYNGCYDGYLGLGEIYEKERKYEKALEYYKKTLETNEDDNASKEAINRIQIQLNK